MDAHEKFRQAVQRRRRAIKEYSTAEENLERARNESTAAHAELARVVHSVFGGRFAVLDNTKYSCPDGEVLSVRTFEGVFVSGESEEDPT